MIVSSGGGGGSAGVGDGNMGGPGSATPVPFLRVLYEREVATLNMPHLKSLDIELQVCSYKSCFFQVLRKLRECCLLWVGRLGRQS